MNYWDENNLSGTATAVVDERGEIVSRASLNRQVATAADSLLLLGGRQLGFLLMRNSLACLVAYLASLRAGHVPLLLSADLAPNLLEALISRYQPCWIAGDGVSGSMLDGSGLHIKVFDKSKYFVAKQLHSDLAILLSTSGTTGSPRLVRLSYRALQMNAASIAEYLEIQPTDRALTILPPSYSYGLSIINSHLLAGASIVLRDLSVLTPEFANTLRNEKVTSISGVPYVYQMLHRIGFGKLNFPDLRTITQAGGHLDDRLIRIYSQLATEKEWRFFVMYGQTEATARISYVPPQRLVEKIGSIGIAIPGGKLELDAATNELVYFGPNVMMGYADTRDDLSLGDELGGILRTGDLARQDEEGYFYITGRLKRFVKLAGNRISLDEVEEKLQNIWACSFAVGGRDERMVVWIENSDELVVVQVREWLQQQYGVHHSMLRVRLVKELLMLPNGKKNYQLLLEDA